MRSRSIPFSVTGTLSSVLEPTGMTKLEIAHVASILFDTNQAGSSDSSLEDRILDVTKFGGTLVNVDQICVKLLVQILFRNTR